MEHLDERRIAGAIWDGVHLEASEREHLSLCTMCHERYLTLLKMNDEFGVARQSVLRAEAENRLVSIFSEVYQDTHEGNRMRNLLGSFSEWVKALPLWDSRTETGMVGVRNGVPTTYRILYGANETEVELMVEPQNGLLRVIGEVMSGEMAADDGLALVELTASPNAETVIETECDEKGRFLFDQVPPGTYVMTITPRTRQMIVFESLELT